MRDCVNCTFMLYSKTEPVIEHSYGMHFAPFNAAYPGLDAHFRAANLPPEVNFWNKVFDFSADNMALPTPHWDIVGT